MKGLALVIVSAILLSYASSAQQSQCDYKVEIMIDSEEFEPADFTWRMKATKIEGKSTNITGTAEIKSDGRTVKSYKPWTSASIAKQKTSNEYTPNLKPGEYEIIAEIKVDCDDANDGNNKDTKTIKIKGEIDEDKKGKNEDTNDDAEASKETSSKKQAQATQSTAIKQQKPDITEETDNVIQLNTNNKNNQKPQITAYDVQQPQIVYESSNEKAKSLIMIFLLTLSILLNIILIWRR